ncbi:MULTISPECIES: hypothetical protein [Cytobacillus]|nr:hypothetical protein [Cytobacillus firmus]MCM3705887.1 hypothetical protein [Cytobacillus firmus]
MINGALTPLLVLGLVLLWIVVRLISPCLADKIRDRICSLLECTPAS